MKKYIAEEIYPKSQTGKCMVYFNMSHHYRRIYSAKPRIDTNLIKKPQAQLCCSSPDVFNFVKRNSVKQPLLMTPRHKVCLKDRGETELFKPKILDSEIESKLKSLPVYEPPQRISTTKAVQTESNETQPVVGEDYRDKEEKSEDNTGLDTVRSNGVLENEKNKYKAMMNPRSESVAENLKFRPLDKSTVMFLKDITDDILRKGIYSNKGLEKLFIHHISRNKYLLPKETMEKEVLRLKKELEMPVECEKQAPERTVKDEEALTALDSLFLPSDIKDKVASSLGLAQKSPLPLPSPKDSFTGSLELTSSNEHHCSTSEKLNKTIDNDENSLQENNRIDIEQISETKEDTMADVSEKISSSSKSSAHSGVRSIQDDNDKTISDKIESINRTKTLSPALEENVSNNKSTSNNNSASNNNSKSPEDVETSSDLSSIHTEPEE